MEMSTGVSLLRTAQSLLTGRTIPPIRSWDPKSLVYQLDKSTPIDHYTSLLRPHRGFGNLGRMAIYFQGAGAHWLLFLGIGEQAHNFEDLGSPAKK